MDINNPADELNHSWVVVQLGKTPTEWYYIDIANGAGYTINDLRDFIPAFTSEYFFAEKSLFDLSHFPDNMAWQLGGKGPETKKEFYSLPVVGNAAFYFGISNLKPITGYIKTKTKVPVFFSFNTSTDSTISTVTLIAGDDKHLSKPVPMNFKNSGGSISFSYQFKREDTFPVRIVVDGKVAVEYMVESTE